MIKNKALFIGLENTLVITRSGNRYPVDEKDWRIRRRMLRVLKRYYRIGYKIIIVTNKIEIEQGFEREKDVVERLNNICDEIIEITNIKTFDIGYIYANKEGYNKKPNPGMAYESAQEFELDLTKCIMIGKDEIDKEFTKRSGIGTFFSLQEMIANAFKL